MNSVVCGIAILFLISTVWIPEINGKKQKLTIIVPHNINYIHHHHSEPTELKKDKQRHRKSHFKHQFEDEENSDEVEKESRYGHWTKDHDEESDAAEERTTAHYAIPSSEHSNNAVRFLMKPAFLYNASIQRMRLPKSYEYLRHENLQGSRHLDETHPVTSFNFN